jgi:hypothetical protein
MRTRQSDLLLTAIAPTIWGSTYIVTTEFLPNFSPITVAMLRAVPAGLLLLLIVRQHPAGIWWLRIFTLGALNFSIFLSMLFVSAIRLPGGVAATVGAIHPLIVVFLATLLLGTPMRLISVLAAFAGAVGVAFLVLTPGGVHRCGRHCSRFGGSGVDGLRSGIEPQVATSGVAAHFYRVANHCRRSSFDSSGSPSRTFRSSSNQGQPARASMAWACRRGIGLHSLVQRHCAT